MSKESIVDASVPSAGRMYDYYLGGHHNFEVDRRAADNVLGLFPFTAKFVRLQRWCLQDLGHQLTYERGFDTVIDFASGLPTQDHLHTVVKEGTRVIYSDYDPVVVEYAREILGDTPNVYFFEADARRPDDLFRRPEVERLLGDKRNVAVIFWGIAAFLSDDELVGAMKALYGLTGDQSCLAFNAQAADARTDRPESMRVLKIYEQMGSRIHIRTQQQYLELVKPWRPDAQGLTSLLDWHGFSATDLSKEDSAVFGPTGAGYGAYLVK